MEKTTEDYFVDWEAHVFGFGYGTGEIHTIAAVRSFLLNVPDEGNYDYECLEITLGPTTGWLLINILCKADIIEYGTSPRYGWLTRQGKALKTFMLSKTVDDMVKMICERDDPDYCGPDCCNCGPHGYEKGRKCPNPFYSSR